MNSYLAPALDAVSILMFSIYTLFAVLAAIVAALVILRLVTTRREERLDKRLARLRPIVADILTNDRLDSESAYQRLAIAVPEGDRKALELVLYEYTRSLKGPEMDALTHILERFGFVEEDMEDLRSSSEVKQARAALHLGRARSARAVPMLLAARDGASETVTLEVLNALSRIGTRESVNGVVDYIAGPRTLQNARLAEVVLERRNAFAPLLRQRLAAGVPRDRVGLMLDLVGALRDPAARGTVVPYLEDGDEAIRSKAARALGWMRDPMACGSLGRSMLDESALVRRSAAESLGRLECARALGPLSAALADPDFKVRIASGAALARLGDEGHHALERWLAECSQTECDAAEAVLSTELIRKTGRGVGLSHDRK